MNTNQPNGNSPADEKTLRASRHGGASAAGDAFIGTTIGNYRVVNVIGRGGMGVVYEAEQEHPKRTVALKVINPGVASSAMLRRLEHEAEVLGRLQHAGIAHIYEAGTFDVGAGEQPFFAMEYVRGEPLTRYAIRNRLGTRQRLELMVKICQAVQHAHQKGIIHRDLKPGNILVTDEGEPKILDFGVARTTDSDLQTTTLRTDIGQLIGTIPYMSPEQAGGNPDELDTRSDVYALGVIAYELLAERLPYDVGNRMIHEAVRVIREEEPTRLSSINRTFRGDVEIIIGKVLEKEKQRRYQSALDFASDIERYLSDQPIVARPPSAAYQFRKFARRNKALVGGVAAVFIVLVAALIGMSALYAQTEAARAHAAEERDRAEAEAQRALAAEAEAEQRAVELGAVANFQASQLAGIETELMGIGLYDSIIDRRRTFLEARGADEEEIIRALAELEGALVGVNFTEVALKTLDENILARALTAIEKQFEDQPLIRARLLQVVATISRELGLLDRASQPQLDALEIRRSVLGDTHQDTLSSIAHMAAIRWIQGDLAEALLYNHEALAGFEEQLGKEHPQTVRILNNLAVLLREQGQLKESAGYHRRVLEIRRRILGDDHEDTLASMSNLGTVAWADGRLDDAEQYMRRAVDGFRRLHGDSHRSTLTVLNQLAGILRSKGEYVEAEHFLRIALDGKRSVFGDNHIDTLLAVNGMGSLLQLTGQYEQAELHFRESLLGFRNVLGDSHSYTVTAMNNLSVLLRETGQLSEAHSLGIEAVETAASTLGEGHWHTAVILAQYALTLNAMGQYPEAEEVAQRAYANMSSVLGPDHPQAKALVERIISSYLHHHEIEPDVGLDAKAEEWRAKLPESDENNGNG